MSKPSRVAVVTGANRGIGLECSRQLARAGLRVVLTARDGAAARAGAESLRAEGLAVLDHALDVTSGADIAALAGWLRAEHGGLDVLINNAGASFQGFDGSVAERTLAVNFFGPLHVTDALLPLLRPGGRVVMVSSSMADRDKLAPPLRGRFAVERGAAGSAGLDRAGLVALMEQFVSDVKAGRHSQEGWPTSAYSVSKIGLNCLTAILAQELRAAEDQRGLLINAACPGWVRTRMGGAQANRSVEEGAETPVWLALLPADGPTGGFFRDQAPASW